MKKKILIIFLSASSLVMVSSPSFGYVTRSRDSHELKWTEPPTYPITLYLRKDTFPSSQDYSQDTYRQKAIDAMNAWTNVRGCSLRFISIDAPNSQDPMNHCDGKNTVAFVNDPDPNRSDEIATTYWRTRGDCCIHSGDPSCTGDPYALYDMDVLFDQNRKWTPSYDNYELAPFGDACCYSFQGTAHHEFGHVLGLDHQDNYLATMITIYSEGCYGGLHGDDKGGARHLYPDNSETDTDLAVSNWTWQGDRCVPVVVGGTSDLNKAPGDAFALNYTVENMGTGNANDALATFYLSEDSFFGSSDKLFEGSDEKQTFNFAPISAWTTSSPQHLTVPIKTKARSYYLITSLNPPDGYDQDLLNNALANYQFVTVINVQPTINVISQRVHPGHILNYPTSVSDDNGDPVTCSGSGDPMNFGATLTLCLGNCSELYSFNWNVSISQALNPFYMVNLTCSDDQGASATAPLYIEVYNTTPSLPQLPAQSVHPGKALSYPIPASDFDGDGLSCSMSPPISGATLNNCTFSWMPPQSQPLSPVSTTVKVADTWSDVSQPLTINVINNAPSITSIPAQSVHPGKTLTFTVSATDLDSDTLNYSPANLPSGATFNASTHVFTWTPPLTQPLGTVSPSPTFTVSDPWASTLLAVSITVTNTAPAITPIPAQSIHPGRALTFTITASDGDSDTLTYSATNLPSGATFNVSTHIFTWNPPLSQPLGTVFPSPTFTVSDPWIAVPQSATINVTNSAPIVTYPVGTLLVNIGSTLSFSMSAYDPESEDPLAYSASGTVFYLGATFNPTTHTFSWTPTTGQQGTYINNFFTTNDPWTAGTQNITITVSQVGNSPPVLNPIGNKSVSVDTLLSFGISASDPDHDSLTYSASVPSWASFNYSTHTFSGTPHQKGNYSAWFSVADPYGASDSETITITVTDPPPPGKEGDKEIQEL